jgi:glycosyltransferase involved in cell wall biosynthesis
MERVLVDRARELFARRSAGGEVAADPRQQERQAFATACLFSQELACRFAREFVEQLRHGHWIDSFRSIAAMAPVCLGIAPYLTAFGAQHKDEAFLRRAAARFPGAARLTRKSERRAWFTETFADVNGAAHTVRTMIGVARRRNLDLTLVTCSDAPAAADGPSRNFTPVGRFRIPEYEMIEVVFPPFLEILAWLEEENFDEVIISTPGPLGLCALGAARLLGLSVRGFYHTDFPRYVQTLTEDESMSDLTWRYMRWFYGGMESVFVPSRVYADELAAHGLDRSRLVLLGRGVDRERFSPDKRDPEYWRTYGLNGGHKFLYVGRISKEKNVERLLEAFALLGPTEGRADLIVVGDGPDLPALRQRYRGSNLVFTGFLTGEDLARAYASADSFVFPSLTDTFGNVVLEAHASGLPAIVGNRGGPAEIVRSHGSGLIVDTASAAQLAQAMARLMEDETYRRHLSKCALAKARDSGWDEAVAVLENPADPRTDRRPDANLTHSERG